MQKNNSSFFNFLKVVQSVLAAMFGVQSKQNLRHDFNQKSIAPYVISGIIFVIGFVLAIILGVQLVLKLL